MEERGIVNYEPGQVAVQQSPMDALAAMSDSEFEMRLTSLQTAQRRMAKVQRDIMDADVDYGVIPGTGSKPTLLKPGAEKLCMFHHLVPTFETTLQLGDGERLPHIRVSTVCTLHYSSADGPVVGQGVGAANSFEKRHRWRDSQRKCPQCGAAAIIKGKAEYGGGWLCFGKKGGCGAKFGDNDPVITEQQTGQAENPDPFDLENTLVKMSAKRAYVDATLRATATSGLFTQDVEDMVDAAPVDDHRLQAQPQPQARTQQQPRQQAQPRQQPQPQPQPNGNGKPKEPTPEQLRAGWDKVWAMADGLGIPADQRPSFPLQGSIEDMITAGRSLQAIVKKAQEAQK